MSDLNRIGGVCVATGMLMVASTASADFVVEAFEVGGDVMLTGSGTLDLSAWSVSSVGGGGVNNSISSEVIITGPSAGGLDVYQAPASFTGPDSIPVGRADANSGAGDTVGFVVNSTNVLFFVESSFVDNAPLSNSTMFLGESFASMGLTLGDSYTWSWGTATGGQDSYTFRVVPAPASAALLGVAGLAATRRRR